MVTVSAISDRCVTRGSAPLVRAPRSGVRRSRVLARHAVPVGLAILLAGSPRAAAGEVGAHGVFVGFARDGSGAVVALQDLHRGIEEVAVLRPDGRLGERVSLPPSSTPTWEVASGRSSVRGLVERVGAETGRPGLRSPVGTGEVEWTVATGSPRPTPGWRSWLPVPESTTGHLSALLRTGAGAAPVLDLSYHLDRTSPPPPALPGELRAHWSADGSLVALTGSIRASDVDGGRLRIPVLAVAAPAAGAAGTVAPAPVRPAAPGPGSAPGHSRVPQAHGVGLLAGAVALVASAWVGGRQASRRRMVAILSWPFRLAVGTARRP